MKDMITQGEFLQGELLPITFKRKVWRQDGRICSLILGVKGFYFQQIGLYLYILSEYDFWTKNAQHDKINSKVGYFRGNESRDNFHLRNDG